MSVDAASLRLYRASERHTVVVLVVLASLLTIAASGLGWLRLDLSFRPLFASGADIAAPTAEFEQVFGQSSGAWITVVVENRGLPTGDYIRSVAALTDRAAGIDGIAEVLSLTSMRVPQWRDGELSFAAPIPDYLLGESEEEELEYQYEELLDGSRFVGWLVSADGNKLLLSGRLEAPLDDLDGRRGAVRAFEAVLGDAAPPQVALHFSGVSLVELAYEKQVLADQLLATALTSIMLMLLLYWTFRSVALVIACLAPVTLAIPATLGVLGWQGLSVTLINTTIPLIILVIGVADAVHMINAWLDARHDGQDPKHAARTMMATTAKACFFTTVTTMAGFLALTAAELDAVGNFGLAAATGIGFAWLANQVLLPIALRQPAFESVRPAARVNTLADALVAGALQRAVAAWRPVVAGGLVLTLLTAALIPSLEVNQRFNEELPAEHPVTVSQDMLEREFGGFLGPEVSVRRTDGGSIIDADSSKRLDAFIEHVRALPETHHAWSVRDLLPAGVRQDEKVQALAALRSSPITAQLSRELVSADNDRLAIILRIGDIGTEHTAAYRDRVLAIAATTWGDGYDADVVGQWWLAQYGMSRLLTDMLTSLATAMLIVAPLLWLALRDGRLFAAAACANILPLLVPLAFMAATGMTLRIGTAVVLALAFGIVVDNTLHIIIRLRTALGATGNVDTVLATGLRGTGRAVVFTTLALVGGFMSMLGNDLLAIRDMGIVAAVTILAAMLADLVLLPAVYVALRGLAPAARRVPLTD